MTAFNSSHSPHSTPPTMPPTPTVDNLSPAAMVAPAKPPATATTPAPGATTTVTPVTVASGGGGPAHAPVSTRAVATAAESNPGDSGSDTDSGSDPGSPHSGTGNAANELDASSQSSSSSSSSWGSRPGARRLVQKSESDLILRAASVRLPPADSPSVTSSPSAIFQQLSIHSQSSQQPPQSHLSQECVNADADADGPSQPAPMAHLSKYPTTYPKGKLLVGKGLVRRGPLKYFPTGDYSFPVKSASLPTPSAAAATVAPTAVPQAHGSSSAALTNAFTQTGREVLTAEDWNGVPELPLAQHMLDPFATPTPASTTTRPSAAADTPSGVSPFSSFSASTAAATPPASSTKYPRINTSAFLDTSPSQSHRRLRVIPPTAPAARPLADGDLDLHRRPTLELDPSVGLTPVPLNALTPPAQHVRRQNTLMPTPPKPMRQPGGFQRRPTIRPVYGRDQAAGSGFTASDNDESFSSSASTVELDDLPAAPFFSLSFASVSDAEDPPAVYRGQADSAPKSCLKRSTKRARSELDSDDQDSNDQGTGDGDGQAGRNKGPAKRFRFAGVNVVKEFDWQEHCFKLGQEREEAALAAADSDVEVEERMDASGRERLDREGGWEEFRREQGCESDSDED